MNQSDRPFFSKADAEGEYRRIPAGISSNGREEQLPLLSILGLNQSMADVISLSPRSRLFNSTFGAGILSCWKRVIHGDTCRTGKQATGIF
jgi:hypothetical protein